MNESKWRGISQYTGEMVYGQLLRGENNFNIVTDFKTRAIDMELVPIVKGTQGEYTGLKDKNGREIYEGDILRVWQEDEYIPNRDSSGGIIDYDCEGGFSQVGKVGFTGCSFDYSTVKTLAGRHEKIHAPIDWINNYEVVGNIYENPELLEVTI